jgi:hypothetical protein
MMTFLVAVTIGLGFIFGIGLFLEKRNIWVYNQRCNLIDEAYKDALAGKDIKNSRYYQLPSYNSMFNRFWIWDVNKFIK